MAAIQHRLLDFCITFETDDVGEGGGHVRIGKVQHTLAKAVHALGCLYLVIILSNYSRFIMLVKKLQFPP